MIDWCFPVLIKLVVNIKIVISQ